MTFLDLDISVFFVGLDLHEKKGLLTPIPHATVSLSERQALTDCRWKRGLAGSPVPNKTGSKRLGTLVVMSFSCESISDCRRGRR